MVWNAAACLVVVAQKYNHITRSWFFMKSPIDYS